MVLSIGGIILDELATSNFPMNPTIIRVMRVLRITRGKIRTDKIRHCSAIVMQSYSTMCGCIIISHRCSCEEGFQFDFNKKLNFSPACFLL